MRCLALNIEIQQHLHKKSLRFNKITMGKPVASHFITTSLLDCISIISSSCGCIFGSTEIPSDHNECACELNFIYVTINDQNEFLRYVTKIVSCNALIDA